MKSSGFLLENHPKLFLSGNMSKNNQASKLNHIFTYNYKPCPIKRSSHYLQHQLDQKSHKEKDEIIYELQYKNERLALKCQEYAQLLELNNINININHNNNDNNNNNMNNINNNSDNDNKVMELDENNESQSLHIPLSYASWHRIESNMNNRELQIPSDLIPNNLYDNCSVYESLHDHLQEDTKLFVNADCESIAKDCQKFHCVRYTDFVPNSNCERIDVRKIILMFHKSFSGISILKLRYFAKIISMLQTFHVLVRTQQS